MTFQKSQDADYLDVCVKRMGGPVLTWVEQCLGLIHDPGRPRLNDIGCNVGQFYKGIREKGINIDYAGYDIEAVYLEKARLLFPDEAARFHYLDIVKSVPREADISVISATLEHVDDHIIALDNILKTSKKQVILRTFLGERDIRAIFKKELAESYYYINQFDFTGLLERFDRHGFRTEVLRDVYTDSMPKYLGQGVLRTQFVINGKK
ncbi:MAG: methyltransferase domain-containing protein [Candidatus Omnitrophota bacterium]